MAQWQRIIDVSSSFALYKQGEGTVQEIAKEVVLKLKSLKEFGNEYIDQQKQDVIESFEFIAEDEESDEDEFNYAFEALYDWGDISLDGVFGGKKVCWIKTF